MKISTWFLIFSLAMSCQQQKSMEIRYTAVNDITVDYVFNFIDNQDNIRQINQYATNKIVKEKLFVTETRKKLNKMTSAERRKFLNENNHPSSFQNIVIYNGDKLTGEPAQKDIVIEYIVSENGSVNQIQIPNVKASNTFPQINKKSEKSFELKTSFDHITLPHLKELLIITQNHSVGNRTYEVTSYRIKRLMYIKYDHNEIDLEFAP